MPGDRHHGEGRRPQPTLLDVTELRKRIEQFAPRSHRQEREQRLYRELPKILRDQATRQTRRKSEGSNLRWSHDPEEAYRHVLAIIRAAHRLYPGSKHSIVRTGTGSAFKGYLKEYERIVGYIDKISDSFIVRWFDRDGVIDALELYELTEVHCPEHGRYVKRCAEIRQQLETLRTLEYPPPLGNLVRRRRDQITAGLRKSGIDPAADPDTFCEAARPSVTSRSLPPPPLTLKEWRERTPKAHQDDLSEVGFPPRGRPRDRRRDFLLETIIPCLSTARLSVEKASEYLEIILRTCFDDNASAETLERQLRSLRSRRHRKSRKTAPAKRR